MDGRTLEFRRFQFNPTPLEEDLSVEYKDIRGAGMSHPFFQYVGGNADEITFDINLNDKGERLGFTEEFLRFMSRFRPKNMTQFSPPPPIILSYGTMQRTGLVTNMKITRDRFDPRSLSTTKAQISITIKTLPV